MSRDTLLDFLEDFAKIDSDYLLYDNGYVVRTWTYREIYRAAYHFAGRLRAAGIGKSERVIVWSESRPEWVAAFWGCLLAGVVVVPIDYRASSEFLDRVQKIVEARVLISGAEVPDARTALPVWKLSEME